MDFMTRDFFMYSGDDNNFDFADIQSIPVANFTYASAKSNLLDIVEPLDKTLILPNLQSVSISYTCEDSGAGISGMYDTYVFGKFRCIRGIITVTINNTSATYYYLTFPKNFFSYKNVTINSIVYQKVKLLSMLYTKTPVNQVGTRLTNQLRMINSQASLQPINGNAQLTEPRFYFYQGVTSSQFTMRINLVCYAA